MFLLLGARAGDRVRLEEAPKGSRSSCSRAHWPRGRARLSVTGAPAATGPDILVGAWWSLLGFLTPICHHGAHSNRVNEINYIFTRTVSTSQNLVQGSVGHTLRHCCSDYDNYVKIMFLG